MDQYQTKKREQKITALLDELAAEVGAYLMLRGAPENTYNRCAGHILALRLHVEAIKTDEEATSE